MSIWLLGQRLLGRWCWGIRKPCLQIDILYRRKFDWVNRGGFLLFLVGIRSQDGVDVRMGLFEVLGLLPRGFDLSL